MDELVKLGHHYICEFAACDQARLLDNDFIRREFFQTAKDSGLSIVGEGSHNFSPHGFTCVLILAESHASIHVWPEYAYCAVDLFTCNLHMDADGFVNALKKVLGAQEVTTSLMDRGCPVQSVPDGMMPSANQTSAL
jgi:S-adenosylmethionine decarboxylase